MNTFRYFRTGFVVAAQHALEQRLMWQQETCISHQVVQEPVLDGSQFHRLTSDADFLILEVNGELARGHAPVGGLLPPCEVGVQAAWGGLSRERRRVSVRSVRGAYRWPKASAIDWASGCSIS